MTCMDNEAAERNGIAAGLGHKLPAVFGWDCAGPNFFHTRVCRPIIGANKNLLQFDHHEIIVRQ